MNKEWKLVPVEPTEEMWEAASKADDQGFEAGRTHGASPTEIWSAMLAAAPEAPAQEPISLERVYEIIIDRDEGGGKRSRRELARRILNLYATPQPATCDMGKLCIGCTPTPWQWLTNGELHTAYIEATNQTLLPQKERLAFAFARKIEAKLKEKNEQT